MTNKILSILLVGLCLLQSCTENKAEKEEEIAKKAGAEVFQANCAACHSGSLSEAPKLASLKLLSKEDIIKALRTGVMRNQADRLSKEQHEQLAAFISDGSANEAINAVVAGKCNEES